LNITVGEITTGEREALVGNTSVVGYDPLVIWRLREKRLELKAGANSTDGSSVVPHLQELVVAGSNKLFGRPKSDSVLGLWSQTV
jgi:hypothetical protein